MSQFYFYIMYSTLMKIYHLYTHVLDDDADLEAELLALEGKAPKKGGKSKTGGKGALSMADVDSMIAGIGDIGDVGSGDDEDDSDIDDEDLLGELKVHNAYPLM